MSKPKLNVLLIQYMHLKGIDTNIFVIPSLALGSIAANLDRDKCNVSIFEFFTLTPRKVKNSENIHIHGSNKQNELLEVLRKHNPDIVGLTCKTNEYHDTLQVAGLVKEFNSEIITVLGGYHATAAGDEILEGDGVNYIDYLIRCEGEKSFNDFVSAIYDNESPKNIPGLSYRENGRVINNPPAPLLDLKQIKFPDRNVRIKKKYYSLGGPVDVIETSRGCVFDCNFCSINKMYGKSFRTYDIERVIDDIRDAINHGAQWLFITDDNITINTKRFEQLCDAIIKAKLNSVFFFVQFSIQGLSGNDNLITKMAKAGIRIAAIGIEAVNDKALSYLNKSNQFKVSETAGVIRQLRKNGIFSYGVFIVGTPEESMESFQVKYRYIKSLKLSFSYLSILTPFPQTAIREKLSSQGLITNLYDYSKYSTWHSNIKTKYLSSDELFRLTRKYQSKLNINVYTIIQVIRAFKVSIRLQLSLNNWLNIFENKFRLYSARSN